MSQTLTEKHRKSPLKRPVSRCEEAQRINTRTTHGALIHITRPSYAYDLGYTRALSLASTGKKLACMSQTLTEKHRKSPLKRPVSRCEEAQRLSARTTYGALIHTTRPT